MEGNGTIASDLPKGKGGKKKRKEVREMQGRKKKKESLRGVVTTASLCDFVTEGSARAGTARGKKRKKERERDPLPRPPGKGEGKKKEREKIEIGGDGGR